MEYGQFCPIAKAVEILGEKWTLLIVRELIMGSTRFNELQRGLSQISPTILTKRLNSLCDYGLVYKKKINGQQGYEYIPTESCKELQPVILALGHWGMRWTQGYLTEDDYDVELLMLYLQRSIMPEKLLGNESVIRFNFTDIKDLAAWWILVRDNNVDVCTKDPGMDVDIHFTCSIKTMINVWMGTIPYRTAVKNGELTVVGPTQLTRNIFSWLNISMFADLPAASQIQ